MQKAGIGLLTLGGGGILAFEANFAISSATANRANAAYVLAIFLAIAGVAILLWGVLRNERVEAPPRGSGNHQEGRDNVQAQATETAIAQRAESGGRNVVVQEGGKYYEATERERLSGGRIMVQREPEDFQEIFDNNLTINARKIVEPFIGKWMKLSGDVGDVDTYETGAHVLYFSDFGNRLPRIFMLFDSEEQQDRLVVQQKGDAVTVLGEINGIEANTLTLRNCELVDE